MSSKTQSFTSSSGKRKKSLAPFGIEEFGGDDFALFDNLDDSTVVSPPTIY
jgi:hypothetical protein